MSRAPIGLTVVTGFLGAGKTTLLNRLLRDPAMADTAVVVNEWGEVGIDHLLIEEASDGVIELSGGCLCCTVRGDLVDTLVRLAERENARPLRRVVVETTGLADPSLILQALMEHPALVDAYRLDGVVTLVDAVHGAQTLDEHREARVQVAVADRIVLTKTDVADAGEVGLRARLGALNGRAQVVRAQDEPGASLLAAGLVDPATRQADVARWLGEGASVHHHDHRHSHGHRHHETHDAEIASFALTHDGALSFSAVETFLDLLRATQGERLLRMKGVVELRERPERPLVLHGVRGSLHPPAWLPAWPEGPRGARLVLIGRGLDRVYAEQLFAAITDRPALDTPDRAALSENPLTIAGFGG